MRVQSAPKDSVAELRQKWQERLDRLDMGLSRKRPVQLNHACTLQETGRSWSEEIVPVHLQGNGCRRVAA